MYFFVRESLNYSFMMSVLNFLMTKFIRKINEKWKQAYSSPETECRWLNAIFLNNLTTPASMSFLAHSALHFSDRMSFLSILYLRLRSDVLDL